MRTNDVATYGEVVWSWRPDAGAKVRGCKFAERRWQKSPVTEESTKDTVKTIAQGMPVDAVYLWLLTPVLFYCTGGYGCNAHPAFPAPSLFSRVVFTLITRASRAAGTWMHVSLLRHAPPPGLAFGEPDDRLQRGIQYTPASRLNHNCLWNTGSPGHPRSSRGQAPGEDIERVAL